MLNSRSLLTLILAGLATGSLCATGAVASQQAYNSVTESASVGLQASSVDRKVSLSHASVVNEDDLDPDVVHHFPPSVVHHFP